MTRFILGLLLGLLLGVTAPVLAQWGNRSFDERTKNWNEQQYQQRQQRLWQQANPCR